LELPSFPAGFDLDAAVGMLANPLQIAGDFGLGAQRFDAIEFLEQCPVGEKAVQGFVTGLAQWNDLAPAFRLGDEVMSGDVAHLSFAQGAVVEGFFIDLIWYQFVCTSVSS
jgi:hypothetical protein